MLSKLFILMSDTAMAQAANGKQPSPFEALWFPMVVLMVVMYFFILRPQQRKAKDHANFINTLKPGDEVVTTGGLIGRVRSVAEQFVTVEIAANTHVKVLKAHVASAAKPKEAAAPLKASEKKT